MFTFWLSLLFQQETYRKGNTHISTDEKSSCHPQKSQLQNSLWRNVHEHILKQVMLSIFNLHTFIFFFFSLCLKSNERTKNERHSETWTNKQKKMTKSLMDFFTSSFVVVAFLYRLCFAYTYDSFFLARRKLSHENVKLTTERELNFVEEEFFISKVINWKICCDMTWNGLLIGKLFWRGFFRRSFVESNFLWNFFLWIQGL